MKINRHMICALVGLSLLLNGCCASPKEAVLIPQLTKSWPESLRILGDSVPGKTFYSDFLLIKDKMQPARWHAVGIHQAGNTFYHAVSPSLNGPWQLLEDITSPDTIVRMWAPYAIWSPAGDSAYMFYHHGLGVGDGTMLNSMRALVSADSTLDVWENYDVYPDEPTIPGIRNIVFTGECPRDACIFFDENVKKYIMYYAENDPRVVRARTSDDAVHWSESVVVMGIPDPVDAYVSPESPFVLYKEGLYYLFVSGFDYARVALYVSEDPFNFGDPVTNKVAEMNGHAPEIVEEEGKYYIVCAHISSAPGKLPGEADLWGTYIQELQWAPADSIAESKIVRK